MHSHRDRKPFVLLHVRSPKALALDGARVVDLVHRFHLSVPVVLAIFAALLALGLGVNALEARRR